MDFDQRDFLNANACKRQIECLPGNIPELEGLIIYNDKGELKTWKSQVF